MKLQSLSSKQVVTGDYEPEMEGVEAERIEFKLASLVGGQLLSCRLPKTNFHRSKFTKVDVSASFLSESSIDYCELNDCRLSGASLDGCLVVETIFKGCKLDLSNFRQTEFRKVRFEDCDLTEADFGEARFSSVVMQGCTLMKTQFRNVKIKGLDLRSSHLEKVMGLQGLSGAKLNTSQLLFLAPELADALGIIVEDQK